MVANCFVICYNQFSIGTPLEAAMKKSVEECICDGILKEFLERYGKEVTGMCLTEFDEEKFRQMMIEEGIALTKRANALNLIGLIPPD